MKTPRELLMSRHQSAQVRLDAIRKEVVAEFVTTDVPRQAEPGFLSRLWQELFWSSRRVWLGFAATWLLMLLVQWMGSGQLGTVKKPGKIAPGIMAMVQEQNKLRRELIDIIPPEPALLPSIQGPRSRATPVYLMV